MLAGKDCFYHSPFWFRSDGYSLNCACVCEMTLIWTSVLLDSTKIKVDLFWTYQQNDYKHLRAKIKTGELCVIPLPNVLKEMFTWLLYTSHQFLHCKHKPFSVKIKPRPSRFGKCETCIVRTQHFVLISFNALQITHLTRWSRLWLCSLLGTPLSDCLGLCSCYNIPRTVHFFYLGQITIQAFNKTTSWPTSGHTRNTLVAQILTTNTNMVKRDFCSIYSHCPAMNMWVLQTECLMFLGKWIMVCFEYTCNCNA